MLNCTIAGNITKDATAQEVNTSNGVIYAIRFTIAINDKFGDKENSSFIPCTYWAKSDKIVPHLTKGKAIIAQIDWYSNTEHEGRWWQDFRVRKIDFQSGKQQSTPPPLNPPLGVNTGPEVVTPNNTEPVTPENPFGDDDDDLPF